MDQLKEFVALCEEKESYSTSGFLFCQSDNEKLIELTALIKQRALELNILSIYKIGENYVISLYGLDEIQKYCSEGQEVQHSLPDISKENDSLLYHKYEVQVENFKLTTMVSEYKPDMEKRVKTVKKNIERE
ncbi:hypothetical protein [Metasolibacillus sp.]|uniref:hypothetical protein n=1 Tax=Metasolibacillus sp. TaxID=2703680 RepID=UPI0025DFE5DC|nr:hypothetical protein [Metasolibacillus sp.]MCT6922781.1 hypothetical protein [Metasolibacillus sp.]MCT6938880.1 hypothetical protein [Metasolibacillus sp.]